MIKNHHKKFKNFLKIKFPLKWALILFLITSCFVFQQTKLFFNLSFGPLCLITFSIYCSIFLSTKDSLIVACICGMIFDCYGNLIFGSTSIFLLLTIFMINKIKKQFNKANCIYACILNSIFVFIYIMIVFVFNNLISDFKNSWFCWLNGFLPAYVGNIAFSIFLFSLFKLTLIKFGSFLN